MRMYKVVCTGSELQYAECTLKVQMFFNQLLKLTNPK